MTKRTQGFENWDFSRLWGDFDIPFNMPFSAPAMPELKFEAIAAAQQRNFEAFASANRVAVEGFQAIAKHNAEFLRNAYENGVQAAKACADPVAPGEGLSRQAELSHDAFEAGADNARKVTAMVRETSDRALRVVADRVAEGLAEMNEFVVAKDAPAAPRRAPASAK
jgi:phasin family protein